MPRGIIKYAQARPIEGKEIFVHSAEMVVLHLNRAFNDMSCDDHSFELDKQHLDILKGMESTWTDVSDNPYTQMIRAIKQLGSIKVWIEW